MNFLQISSIRLLCLVAITGVLAANDSRCTVTSDKLIEHALYAHPSIKSAHFNVDAAHFAEEAAFWGYLPSPSVELSGSDEEKSAVLRLEQPLWSGGKLDATYDKSGVEVKISELRVGEKSFEIAEQMIKAMRILNEANGRFQALLEGKDELYELRMMVSRRVEAGVSPRGDLDLINSRIYQMEADIAAAKASIRNSRRQIGILIGSKNFNCHLGNEPVERIFTKDEQAGLLNSMASRHPVLKISQLEVETIQHDKTIAQASLWPQVVLRADWQRASSSSSASQTDKNVYVTFRMVPGSGLSTLSNLQASEMAVLSKRAEFQTKQMELSDLLFSSFDEYETASGRIKDLEKMSVTSEKVLASYKRLFLAGKRSWLDLVNSVRELTENKIQYADAQAGKFAAYYNIRLYSGQLISNTGALL